MPATAVSRAPVPFPLRRPESVVEPVPPFATERVPVMSEVRLIREVETTPALAFRKPSSAPRESELIDAFEATRFVTDSFVVVAFERSALRIEVVCVVVA